MLVTFEQPFENRGVSLSRVAFYADKAFGRLLLIMNFVAQAGLIILSLFTFLIIIARNVFNVNIPGMFEFTADILVIFTFFTAAYLLKTGNHIRVDIITSSLHEKSKKIINIFGYIISLFFTTVFTWKTCEWGLSLFKNKTLTYSAIAYPQYIMTLLIAFGFFALTIAIIREIIIDVSYLRNIKTEDNSNDKFWLPPITYFVLFVISLLVINYVNPIIGLIFLASIILFAGVPVFLALGVISFIGIYFFLGPKLLIQAPISSFYSIHSFPLASLPLFVLGGLILERTGIIKDLLDVLNYIFKKATYGLLFAVIIIGFLFCAMTGSSVGATAVVATVALPELFKRGYNKRLCVGLVAGSTVGQLIPPSIEAILFGIITGVSIADLFMAGIGPAVVLFGMYFIYILIKYYTNKDSLFEKGVDVESQQVISSRELLAKLKYSIWGILTPTLILGGIFLGVITPTEAAGAMVVLAVFISLFVKKIKFKALIETTIKASNISGMMLCIVASASIFATLIAQTRVNKMIIEFITTHDLGPGFFLLFVFFILLILGMFLDGASVLMLTLPVFFPVVVALGINPLVYAIYQRLLAEIGLLTPPVGLNLFAIKAVTDDLPLSDIIKGSFPFLIMMVLCLIISLSFPAVVTWLPGIMK
jgi:C4-dicarboxylate transporter DctM subunit